MKFIRKRDGQLVPFDDSRIKRAIFYALAATGNPDKLLAEELKEEVVRILETTYGDELIPDIEDIQDVVEKVLMKRGETEAAKHYILYRKQHQELRDFEKLFKTAINLVDNYLEDRDWRIRENSNMSYSLQGLNFHVSSS
ncbi:MAG TPA: ribonucleoside triphosphate reductase, partial [candidate division WOR-3 bacterium]|nr:ribonucleoside triphosphate reductase [candidate division WOR-3 bacterium]